MAATWHALVPAARAETRGDYLVQMESAMGRIDGHMVRLSRRFSGEGTPTRCSFQAERRKYNDTREALRGEIRQARVDRFGAAPMRPQIEARLDELKRAYSRALVCYP